MRSVDLALLTGGLILVYLASPFAIEGDGGVRFRALSRLLSEGALDATPYSLVGPLFSAPLWWVGSALGDTEWWVGRYNFVLFGGSPVAFYRILTPAIDRDIVVRFLLIVTVASMFPHHLGRYYGEVFTAVMMGLGLALVCVRGAYWGWLLAVLGVANTPAAVPGLALVAIAWSWHTRDPRHLIPIAAAAMMVTGESWLRRGGPFVTGYEGNRGAETVPPFSSQPGFSYPFVLGILSILFSFGKGVFLFAPGLLLVPRRIAERAGAARAALMLWSLFLAGLVAVYSKWWAWYGGVFWGPRFFLFASIPASLALASWSMAHSGPRWRPWLASVAILWSCWVGVNGLVYRNYALDVCTSDHYTLEFLCWYVPEFSTLFGPLTLSRDVGTMNVVLLSYFAVVGLWLVCSTKSGPKPGASGLEPTPQSPSPDHPARSP